MYTMNIVHKHFFLTMLLLFLLPCFPTVSLARTEIANITTDQLALLELKSRITERPFHHRLAKNWTAGSFVCDWVRVTCGSRHQRVTALDLSNMNLTGTIPPHLGNLSFLVHLDMSDNNFNGELPDEFSQLRRLKVLDFSHNNLSGQFPPWIGSLQELEYLSLRFNSFTGVIPQSISNMSKLTTLVASYNQLVGNFPEEIYNMSFLETISLGVNRFSASFLPDNICQRLQKLRLLGLSQTGLIGQIPSNIGQCSQLQVLHLSANKLNGGIPKEIANLTGLQELALLTNVLDGVIPKEIGNLSMLWRVDLSDNNLTGVIPDEIGKLSNVQEMNFAFNKLDGSIPVDIFNISSITKMNFDNNYLSGNLPSPMSYNLPNLIGFYLGKNMIGGTIPYSISNCSYLEILELSENSFTGFIPNSLGDLSFLQILDLSDNSLVSDPSSLALNFITSLAKCNYLSVIALDNNPLAGILPDSIGNLSFLLRTMSANSCKLFGTIPSGIGNLSSLNELDLVDNHLIGSFPNSITNLENLQRIHLGGNKMSISLQLFCACQNLGLLALEENYIIGGTIPNCLGNISTMRELYLRSNGLNSTIPMTLWNLKDILVLDLSSNLLIGFVSPEISNFLSVTSIDFSSNYFSGDIPITIGDLETLQNLSLAHNQLQGHIPETIGKMWSLEKLDLSYNYLSGSLPVSLEKLQELTFLNVSFNNLSGEIPSQGPFINLTAESFISNQALCGARRFHVPPCPEHSTHHHTSRINKHKLVIILAMMISVAGIFCLGLMYLKYKNSGKITNGDHEGFSLFPHKRVSYYDLLRATGRYNQSNLFGNGSFGSVYKATFEDGGIVAVKVFNLQIEGSFKSFDIECEVLRNLRHRNLTKVISSCSNPDFKALVLEYMPNGSLDGWLHSNNSILNVMQRLNILIDVACAIEYLHCGNLTPIVHCDLKPSNVLLDQEMVAHVSDFGIAKLLGQDNVTYTKTLATLCYIAPEYASEGLVSTRCDIYSFGIMMMEVFTRKSPSDEMFGENLSLKSWVTEFMPNRLVNIIDVELLSTFNRHHHEILANILSIMDVALSCTKEFPRERSNIEEVLASLNKIKLQLLPYTNDLGEIGGTSTI